MLNAKHQGRLILFAMALGLAAGFLISAGNGQEYFEWVVSIGHLFIRLLKMVVSPLIFSSVFLAVLNLGNPQSLGKLGKRTLFYYLLTTSIAVGLALVVSFVLAPGENAQGLDQFLKVPTSSAIEVPSFGGRLLEIVPTNPFAALAGSNMLPVIFFSLFLGLGALFCGDKAKPFASVMRSLESLSLWMIKAVMLTAPVGVFALLFDVALRADVGLIKVLWSYGLTVFLALGLHFSLLLVLGTRYCNIPLGDSVKKLSKVFMTAFSTASSAATLPVTLSTLQKRFQVREETTNFVVPLGATVNMDGSAIYATVVTVFTAQLYGIPLGMTQIGLIFVTASLASIGTAAAPGAGLLTLTIVMSSVGVPLEGIQIVLGFDRLLDMLRTVVNVTGDAIGALVLEKWALKHG